MNVIKRDGTLQEFNIIKPLNAFKRVYKKGLNQDVPEKLFEQFEDAITAFATKNKNKDVDIEEIQDFIRDFLIKKNQHEAVESFILYRENRTRYREENSKLQKNIATKLYAKNIQNQNANVDEASFGGRIGEASRVVTKDYALKHCMSKMSRKNHEEGWIYIHDLDSYAVGMHNCLSIPFDDLLSKGFNTRQGDVRPASSVNTAFQLVAVIFQLQSLQQFGGVSATHLDWTMVPYVRMSFWKHYNDICDTIPFCGRYMLNKLEPSFVKEQSIDSTLYKGDKWYSFMRRYIAKKAKKRTIKELDQAVEGMYHNLNTLQSRSGNQLPFTSINYGTCTSVEGRMVTKSILEGIRKGIGRYGKTSIFPCGIFQYMKGVNAKPGTPNYDLKRLALKSTTERIYPNYANVDWSGNAGYDRNDPTTYFSTMGCRTANGFDVNGFGQKKDGRGNICPVTIIMPKLAIESKLKVDSMLSEGVSDEDKQVEYMSEFMSLLDIKISEAKDMLIERFNWICSQSAASAQFMYENGTMAGYIPEEGIISALKHGTLAIGQLGLSETLRILIGCDHTEERGMNFAKKIEKLFYDRCAEYKQTYKLNFGVYYTPAENLCYTAYKKFVSQYGHINGITNYWKEDGDEPAHWEPRNYFTNSIHVPVWMEIDPFKKVDIESQLTGYSTAGCITYVELPSTAMHNIDAVETMLDYMMDHDIPYAAFNFPLDYCPVCHTRGDFNGVCPVCGSIDIEELRRVTGYLSTTKKNFNLGKQAETDDRVKHIKN